MDDSQIIEQLYRYGHFRNPRYPRGWRINRQNLHTLSINDAIVQDAIESYCELADTTNINEALELKRCGLPDYDFAGVGSWPMPCQKAGVTFSLDKSRMPSVLNDRIESVMDEVVKAYYSIGLRLIRVTTGGNIRIRWSQLGSSTIGLAEFNSQSCSDVVSCQLDVDYSGLMFELITHEIGHNCNLQHTRGGIMNPYIINVEPNVWSKQDPSYPVLMRYFGDVLPPDPDPDPPPPPPDPNPPPEPNPGPIRRFIEWLRKRFN